MSDTSPTALPPDASICLQVRAPTSVGAPLICELDNVHLNDTLATLRERLASLPPTAAVASDDGSPRYPLNLAKPYQFVRGGGQKTVALAAESKNTIEAFLPAAPPTRHSATAASRFQFHPPAKGGFVSAKPRYVLKAGVRVAVEAPSTPQWRPFVIFVEPAKTADDAGGSEPTPLERRLGLQELLGNPDVSVAELEVRVAPAIADTPDLIGRTALHEAAHEGWANAVAWLAQLDGVRRDAFDQRGETALHLAVRAGKVTSITALLDAGVPPLIPAASFAVIPQETPLHLALRLSRSDIVGILCEAVVRGQGGDLTRARSLLRTALDSKGQSPLSLFASIETPLLQLCYDGNAKRIRELQTHALCDFAAQLKTRGPANETVLHAAARSGNVDVLRDVIANLQVPDESSSSQLLQAVDCCGRTALHVACAAGHVEAVMVLVTEASLSLTALDNQRRSPLLAAAYSASWAVLHELASSAAAHFDNALPLLDVAGHGPLHVIVGEGPIDTIKTLVPRMPRAVREQQSEAVGACCGASAIAPSPRRVAQRLASSTTGKKDSTAAISGPTPLWCAVHGATGRRIAADERALRAVEVLMDAGTTAPSKKQSSKPSDGTSVAELIGYAVTVGRMGVADLLVRHIGVGDATAGAAELAKLGRTGDMVGAWWLVEQGVGIVRASPSNDGGGEDADAIVDVVWSCMHSCGAGSDVVSDVKYILERTQHVATARAFRRAVDLDAAALIPLLSSSNPPLLAGCEGPAIVAHAAREGRPETLKELLRHDDARTTAIEKECKLATLYSTLSALSQTSRVISPTILGEDGAPPTEAQRRYDACGVALLVDLGSSFATAPRSTGLHHPLLLLTLAASNGLWNTVECALDLLAELTQEERQDAIDTMPPRVLRGTELHAARKAGCRPQVEWRTALSYAAEAAPVALVRRVAIELSPPAKELDDCRGPDHRQCTATDYAFLRQNAEAVLLCAASGILPHRSWHTDCSVEEESLTAIMAAVSAVGQRASTPEAPDATAALFVALLNPPSVFFGATPSAAVRELPKAFAGVVRRILRANGYRRWAVGAPLRAVLAMRRAELLTLLLDDVAELTPGIGAEPGRLLMTAVHSTPSTKGLVAEGRMCAEAILRCWPRRSLENPSVWTVDIQEFFPRWGTGRAPLLAVVASIADVQVTEQLLVLAGGRIIHADSGEVLEWALRTPRQRKDSLALAAMLLRAGDVPATVGGAAALMKLAALNETAPFPWVPPSVDGSRSPFDVVTDDDECRASCGSFDMMSVASDGGEGRPPAHRGATPTNDTTSDLDDSTRVLNVERIVQLVSAEGLLAPALLALSTNKPIRLGERIPRHAGLNVRRASADK